MNLQVLETLVRNGLNGEDAGPRIAKTVEEGLISQAEQGALKALAFRMSEHSQGGRADLRDTPDPIPSLTWI